MEVMEEKTYSNQSLGYSASNARKRWHTEN